MEMVAAGGAYILIAMVMVFWGNHNVDEGYYHLIAKLTAEGALPYRDYFCVQTPLYPLVYGNLFKIFGSSLIMARSISMVLGLMSFLLAVRIARNLLGVNAGLAAAALILVQPFTIYFLTIVKLYALTSFLLTVLVFILTSKLQPVPRYTLAAATAALAVCTRLTVLPALPLVVLIAFIRPRGMDSIKAGLAALATGIVVTGAVMLPFQILSPETFQYGVFGYHLDKEGFSLFRQISHRLDVIFRLSLLYSTAGIVMITSVLVRLQHCFYGAREDHGAMKWPPGAIDAAWVIAGVILFHFTSEMPYGHRYLAMMLPPVAAILGPELVRLMRLADRDHFPAPILLGLAACAMMFAGTGQPETRLSNPGPVAQLRQVSSEIEMVTGPDDEILTFNNSVAAEAGRRVLPGDEMNVLTYHPEWDVERCRKFHVLNADMLEEALETGRVRAALITKYSFIGNFPTFYNPGETGARPRIMYALEKHYRRVRTFPGFGYLGEDAELYLPLDTGGGVQGQEFETRPDVQVYKDNEIR